MFLILLFLKSNINMIVNIHNPIPILQQKPSSITTNTLIPVNFQPQLQETQESQESQIQKSQIQKSQESQIQETQESQEYQVNINQQISSDFIEFFNNMFEKPNDTPWPKYIIDIISKKKRYTYIGLFFILIAIYMLIIRN
jgi:hypothetical protein